MNNEDTNHYFMARLNIHYTHNFLREHLLEMLKPIGLSDTQFNVLRILRTVYPESASVSYIKDQMIDRSSDVSRLIDRLHSKKYLIRKEDKLDRRQKEIQLTQTGIALINKIGNHEELLNSKINHLSINEVKQLNGLLNKIRN